LLLIDCAPPQPPPGPAQGAGRPRGDRFRCPHRLQRRGIRTASCSECPLQRGAGKPTRSTGRM